MKNKFGIVIHGGAGTILPIFMTDELIAEYRTKLNESIQAGYKILQSGGSALDAVEASIIVMEDSPLFNAGKGAVFTNDGSNEQDASIMNGADLQAGGVTCVKHVKNPIKLARTVMEKSEHVLLGAEGAERFAAEHNIELVDEKYFHTDRRWDQLQKILLKEKRLKQKESKSYLDHTPDNDLETGDDGKHGTVGAVALDSNGNLAAATSSGGMTNKKYSRIGDSPIIGAGNYANNKTCAVSTTGHGEYFMRALTAYDLHALMSYNGMSLADASEYVIKSTLTDLGGTGGLIAIDCHGNFALPFNTPGMYRGYRRAGDTEATIGIFNNDQV